MGELPRDSDQLADWYAHLLVPPNKQGDLDPAREVAALAVVGIAMAGLERLIGEGRVANVELSFDITLPDGGDPTGFAFSSPDQVTEQ